MHLSHAILDFFQLSLSSEQEMCQCLLWICYIYCKFAQITKKFCDIKCIPTPQLLPNNRYKEDNQLCNESWRYSNEAISSLATIVNSLLMTWTVWIRMKKYSTLFYLNLAICLSKHGFIFLDIDVFLSYCDGIEELTHSLLAQIHFR